MGEGVNALYLPLEWDVKSNLSHSLAVSIRKINILRVKDAAVVRYFVLICQCRQYGCSWSCLECRTRG